ncbi:hypothetical protein KC19_3G048700 [Ceratodon purpureus]|uniref:Uncharacterized protein n=1 Tax=Ceratodon purpureus TaxID=3225 RepID=A0A8T0IGZ4_CERPU|nr:hypothetical protein KC19_3G048700 [Ceratodon purpureus]
MGIFLSAFRLSLFISLLRFFEMGCCHGRRAFVNSWPFII